MSSIMDKIYHRRLNYFEAVDRYEIQIVPRYKTSGLSGDEWRQHVQVTGFFKGLEVFSFGAGRMESALAMLPGKRLEWSDNGIADGIREKEKVACDQPTCASVPTVFLQPKRLTSSCGEYLDPEEEALRYYRQFCAVHAKRGCCSREDSDDNYEAIEDPR